MTDDNESFTKTGGDRGRFENKDPARDRLMEERRKVLKEIGKYVMTTPTMITLITSQRATAQSGMPMPMP